MAMQTVALGQTIWLNDATVTPVGMALLVQVGAAGAGRGRQEHGRCRSSWSR